MNATHVEALARSLIPQTVFLGVFPAHKIPSWPNKTPFCFIANTDTADKSGQHWVAFYFGNDHKGHFFDSFGRHPKDLHFDWNLYFGIYARARGAPWTYNNVIAQKEGAETCGLHCVYYLVQRVHSSRAVSDYTIVSKMNDNLVIQWGQDKGVNI